MSLPYSASNPALSEEKINECHLAGKTIYELLNADLKPRVIMTREAFENAITIVMALGGSTNAILHLIAMAKAAGVKVTQDDFQQISNKTPVIADLKPSGKYLMEDLHHVGGIPAVMKYLLEKGFLNGDCVTVTGKTIKENLSAVAPLDFDKQDVIHPIEKAIKQTGHIQILYGNLADGGAVAKISGKEGDKFTGTARVFDSEFDLIKGIENKKIKEGDVIVIRYVGPKGAPGMPEMLKPTSVIIGAGLGKHVALITDGRFSGGTHGFVVGHITPEAFDGGTLALVQDEDVIEIDAQKKEINLLIDRSELEKRKQLWKKPALKVKNGVLWKYSKLVKTAADGCVTDEE